MFAEGKLTTNRNVIKKWAQARHGWPALIRRATSAGFEMVLSIVFPDSSSSEIARKLTWDEFFDQFEQQHLVFVYQEKDQNQRLSKSFAFL